MAEFSKRQADALISEILAIRCQFAAERVLIAFYRLFELTKRAGYNPAEPRLPRGMTGGGRWTDEGGGVGGSSRSDSKGKRIHLAQARTGGRGLRPPVRTSRDLLEATPRQEVEVVIATMWADRAISRVRGVDPNWSPQPSLHSTIEGEIAYQRRIPAEADAYLNSILRPLGAPAAPSRRIGDNGGPPLQQERIPPQASPFRLLVPDGNIVGYRAKGAGREVRTLSSDVFDSMVLRLTEGRAGIEPPNSYRGVYYYYDLPDRCVIGFRMSKESGLTFEIIESEEPRLERRTKFHKGD